jgi:uncharacterized protein YneR
MAEANLTLPDGTTVKVSGSPEEIAKLMALYGGASRAKKIRKGIAKLRSSKKRGESIKKKGPINFILELKNEGFFKEKRSVIQVQKKLEEKGHIYSRAPIAVPLLRLVRKKELGRVREKDIWYYVHR